jgi:hypothetical protein
MMTPHYQVVLFYRSAYTYIRGGIAITTCLIIYFLAKKTLRGTATVGTHHWASKTADSFVCKYDSPSLTGIAVTLATHIVQ